MFDDPASSVTIEVDRCLNNRHAAAACRRCVEACPVDAIAIGTQLPDLDPERCVHCGACTPVCPTDAVAGSDVLERRLIETCAAVDAPAITLTCSLHPHPTPHDPLAVVIRHGRCLAAVNSEQLLAVAGHGARTVGLDLSWCTECTIGTAADVAVTNAETANALASLVTARPGPPVVLYGLPGSTDSASADPIDQPTVIDSRRAPMSRRGMFASLRARATSTIERSQQSPPPPLRRVRGPLPNRLPQSIPVSRQRLLDRLASMTTTNGHDPRPARAITASDVPLADVIVDQERCSGCGMCAQYCPTGALSFSISEAHGDESTSFTLGFRANVCIDCGLCAIACPESAVTFGSEITADALHSPTWSTVASAPLVACASCGLPTAGSSGEVEPRCFSCRLGTGVVNALRDDAGLMADLIARTRPHSDR